MNNDTRLARIALDRGLVCYGEPGFASVLRIAYGDTLERATLPHERRAVLEALEAADVAVKAEAAGHGVAT